MYMMLLAIDYLGFGGVDLFYLPISIRRLNLRSLHEGIESIAFTILFAIAHTTKNSIRTNLCYNFVVSNPFPPHYSFP